MGRLVDPHENTSTSLGKISSVWWVAILLTAILVRLPFALDPGLTGDEVNYVLIAKCSALDILTGAALDPSNPPLYMLVLHVLIKVAGEQVWAWKMMSVVMNVAAIVLMTVLIRRWVSRRTAVLAGMLAAIHPWQTYMATEVRGYALAGLCAVVALEAADRFERQGSNSAIALWAFACAAGFWTHYSVAVVALITGIYMLIRIRRDPRRVLALFAAGAASMAVMLLWLPRMLGQAVNSGGRPEHLWHLAGFPIVQCLGTTYLRPNVPLLWMAIGGLIAASVYGFVGTNGFLHLFRRNRSKLVLILAFLAATVVVPLARSAVIGGIVFSARYTFIANIAMMLLVACGIAELRPRPRLIALFLVILLSGISLVQFNWFYKGRSLGRNVVSKTLEETQDAQAWIFPNMVTALRARFYSNGKFPVAFVKKNGHEEAGIVKPNATWLDVVDSKYRSDKFFTQQGRDRLQQFDVIWYWSRQPHGRVPSILGDSYIADRTIIPLSPGGFGAERPPNMIRYRKISSLSK